MTQGPTETSIGDFWRMVWQERASCIVMVTRYVFQLQSTKNVGLILAFVILMIVET